MRTLMTTTAVLLALSTAGWAQQSTQVPPTGTQGDTVGVKGMPGNKSGPAAKPGQMGQSSQNSSSTGVSAGGDSAAGANASGVAGMPGNKSGPAAKPGQGAQGNQNLTLTFNTVKQDLQKAGFTNIELLNAAYLIQAKSKDGNTVVMMVNPPSFSAVEAVQPNSPGYAQSPSSPTNSNTRR